MVYLITGMMRSGTSMLMQACAHGGLPIRANPARDVFNAVQPDGFRLNPVSLFEVTEEQWRSPGFAATCEGHAVKCVLPWLVDLPVHPPGYSVVLLHRDHEELRQANEAARIQTITTDQIAQQYDRARALLRTREDVRRLIELEYRDIVEHPARELARIGWPFDVARAASVVDPSLYTFRLETLVVGL